MQVSCSLPAVNGEDSAAKISMIQEFVNRFMDRKGKLEAKWSEEHPESYADIVKSVVEILYDDDDPNGSMDSGRIHEIDDGDYQGTLVFIIAATNDNPTKYWYIKIFYGSCSGCDTLKEIRDYLYDPPTSEQLDDYMTLALHTVQGLKEMDENADVWGGENPEVRENINGTYL